MAAVETRTWSSTVFAIAIMLAGCGTTYINPEDKNPRYKNETTFVSDQRVEPTYRRIYSRLYKCTSGYYRIKGKYHQDTKVAELNVDTGAGFENDAYLADAHLMRVTIEPDGSSRSKVTVQRTAKDTTPFAGAMESWVNEGLEGCGA
jgi:hypothetical protein